jgi:antitoxin PrlF
MYANAKITSKGQITIPAEIREALGACKGDTLVFETTAEYVTVRRQPTLQEIIDRISEVSSPFPISDKSDDELIAEGIMEHWAEKEKHFGGPFLVGPEGSFIWRDGAWAPYSTADAERDEAAAAEGADDQ